MPEPSEESPRHDPLTGLADRGLLRLRAEQAAALARRHGHQVGLLYLDLHGVAGGKIPADAPGDRLLRFVARRLRRGVRESDTAARLGSGEFAVLFARLDDREGAVRAAGRVLDRFRAPYRVADREVELSPDAGLSLHPRHAPDFEELVHQAELAASEAGTAGDGEVPPSRRGSRAAAPPRPLGPGRGRDPAPVLEP